MSQHYRIVSARTLEDLTAIVNENTVADENEPNKILWRAQAGPFIVERRLWQEPADAKEKIRVAQALVRYDD